MKLSIETHKPFNHSVMKNLQTAGLFFKAPFRGLGVFLLLALSVHLYAQVELNSTGSGNAYLLSYPGVFSYTNGISFTFKANFANTASATINVNGLGATTIKKHQGTNLAADDIKNGQVVTLVYDGTNFQMTSGLGNAPSGGGGGQTLSISNDTLSISGGNSVVLPGGGNPAWELTGNTGTDSAVNFIGTTDAQPLMVKINNNHRLKIRLDGGIEPSMSYPAIAIGPNALANGYFPLDNYGDAIAIGREALRSYVGYYGPSIAIGQRALFLTTEGIANTAVGHKAFMSNTLGEFNTGLGFQAGYSSDSGSYNTAIGSNTLGSNSSGSYHTALGYNANVGSYNLTNATAIGSRAQVGASNSMVLGSINGVNSATASTKVGIGTTTPTTTLHVVSTAGAGTGFRLVDGSQGANKVLTSDASGNATWQAPGGGGGGGNPAWELTGNSGTDTANNFIGTSDNMNLRFKTNGKKHMELTTRGHLELSDAANAVMIGRGAGMNLTGIGTYNIGAVAIGDSALAYGASQVTTGSVAIGQNALKVYQTETDQSVAIGTGALSSLPNGTNTAIGTHSMTNTVAGNYNTAVGHATLASNTSGEKNVAIGHAALGSNNVGSDNTAIGYSAMGNNLSGHGHIAIGRNALSGFTGTGSHNANIAIGNETLTNYDMNDDYGFGNNIAIGGGVMNLIGENSADGNVSVGFGSVGVATSAFSNTSVGTVTLAELDSGNLNVALGYGALYNMNTGSSNTGVGSNTNIQDGLTNATAIGAYAYVADSNSMVLGSINGVNSATASTKVGIGTTAPTTKLHIAAEDGAYTGFRLVDGNEATGRVLTSDADGNATWVDAGGGGGAGWALTGNSVSGSEFIGTTNSEELRFKVDGQQRLKLRLDGGIVPSMSYDAIAIGINALANGYSPFDSYGQAIAIGRNALASYIGDDGPSIAIGENALELTTTGTANVAVGNYALQDNTTGGDNTGLGAGVLYDNTTGSQNTAIGRGALFANTTGNHNTALGFNANVSSVNLTNATAIGDRAEVGASNSMVLGSINGTNGATASAKVGIGTTTPSTTLHIVSTAGAGTGFRLVDGSQGANKVLTSDANGNATWQTPGGGGGSGWNLTGNSGTDTANNFIGTTDAKALIFKVNSQKSGYVSFAPSGNTSFGYRALVADTGNSNTAYGYKAMEANTSGYVNAAFGNNSLNHNTSGQVNTAVGAGTLLSNTTGGYNTAVGGFALSNNSTGYNNTAIGSSSNVATGALYQATAIGYGAVVAQSYSMVLGDTTNIKVGIGTGEPSASLHIDGTFRLQGNGAAAGRALISDANGNGTWQPISGGGGTSTAWDLSGNSGTDTANNFIGTTDDVDVLFKTNNLSAGRLNFSNSNTAFGVNTPDFTSAAYNNTALGGYSLKGLTNGAQNTAVGTAALTATNAGSYNTSMGAYSMYLNSTGSANVAVGSDAMLSNSTGNANTAVGHSALYGNTTPGQIVAIGDSALFNNAGTRNTAVGSNALFSNLENHDNTAVGYEALYNNNYADGSMANGNTAIGSQALYSNFIGSTNTAIGANSLFFNTTGGANTAMGANALVGNEDGNNNVAMGYNAMANCTTNVEQNVAVGSGALQYTSVNYLTAVGFHALQNNTGGVSNTAIGYSAMRGNIYGDNNTAVGNEALVSNQYGSNNVAIGQNTLASNGSGENNTAVGTGALYSNISNNNVAVGKNALQNNTTGTYNTAIGAGTASTTSTGNHNLFAGHSTMSISDGSGMTVLGSGALVGFGGTDNITLIGHGAFYATDNSIRLGNSLVTTVEGPVAYTFPSDGRFKTNVSAADVKGLDFITKLRPVNYNFDTRKYEEYITRNAPDSIRRKHLAQDFTKSTAIRQTGFIAQEVEKAAKETGFDFASGLHTPKNENEYYSVAYSQFVVPLVKAVQELNAKVEALEKENTALKAEKESKVLGYQTTYNRTNPVTVDDLQNQINELKKLLDKKADSK